MTVVIPQLQLAENSTLETKGQLKVAMSWWGEFLGPCTQVLGRGPCPQGHGPHH